MKKLVIVYNSAIDNEIMDLLAQCEIKSYTKIENVFGTGKISGSHLGSNVWPGTNDMLIAVVADPVKDVFLEKFTVLKSTFSKEGLKLFVENVEEVV